MPDAVEADDDGPMLLSHLSSFFQRRNGEVYAYSKQHSLMSYDTKDLDQTVKWAQQDIDIMHQPPLRSASEGADEVDWPAMAAQLSQQQQIKRKPPHHITAFQCMTQYYNSLMAKHGPWLEEEDAELLRLAEEYQEHHWTQIAADLAECMQQQNQPRSPIACLQRYRQLTMDAAAAASRRKQARLLDKEVAEERKEADNSTTPHVLGGAWHEDEERFLFLAGLACDLPLQAATAGSAEQLRAFLQEDEGQEEEDDGNSIRSRRKQRRTISSSGLPAQLWVTASKLVGSRSHISCREKWCNQLDPSLVTAPLSSEEEHVLASVVKKLGPGHWAEAAHFLPGRTDAQVRSAWYKMMNRDRDGDDLVMELAEGGTRRKRGRPPARRSKQHRYKHTLTNLACRYVRV